MIPDKQIEQIFELRSIPDIFNFVSTILESSSLSISKNIRVNRDLLYFRQR